MKSRRQMYCTNCKNGLQRQFVFQGVVICETCHKIATRLVDKAKKELEMLFLTYTDMLRVAIVRGELNFPQLPTGTRMPRSEIERAFQEMAKRIGGADAPEAQGDSRMHPLPDASSGPGNGTQRGGRPHSLPRRRGLRPVPEMQEDGSQGDRDPSTDVEATEGLAQDPGGVDGRG